MKQYLASKMLMMIKDDIKHAPNEVYRPNDVFIPSFKSILVDMMDNGEF